MKLTMRILFALAAASCLGLAACGPVTEAPVDTAMPTLTFETPDPSAFELGEGGRLDTEYIMLDLPDFFSLLGVTSVNSALYDGYDENGSRYCMSYTADMGGSYADEIGGFDRSSYQEFLNSNNSDGVETYFVDGFEHISIAGHEAVAARYSYDNGSDHVELLQYTFNVNGWILNICFTSSSDFFPDSFEESIYTIQFKDGY